MRELAEDNGLSGSEIAVIGMAGRFPGAKNIEQFWRNLCDGVESITFLSDEQLEPSVQGPIPLSNPNFVKAAAVLDDIELFDAAFFDYTPREAEIMDPQHRLFLECAWESLEHAGYYADGYKGAIGVFGGSLMSTYLLNLYLNSQIMAVANSTQIGLGNNVDFLATGISYKLNLKGPSCTVQTACSTSLVAIHLACQSLLDEECDMALAGGVAIRLPQRTGYVYQEGGILSPDGHCRAFDAQAQGTILGNGAGMVVLKRLEDALADGDTIHAVIKGSAINNDGAAKVGFTAPSVEGQAKVIVEALANAGVNAASINYVETHGTATTLGDPIEIQALTTAFRQSAPEEASCRIGSVKSNIGHVDAAAGVAGFIKTVLALKHALLPPSLHFTSPNPRIDFANSPFHVNTKLNEWRRGAHPRRAAVSSLGIGGTNAHVILEEAPRVEPSAAPSRAWQLLTLSAKTGSALDAATRQLAEQLKQQPELKLPDVAYTLQVGRKPFSYRRMLVGRDVNEAVAALETQDAAQIFSAHAEPGYHPVVFMFPGQSAQHINMGRDLYRSEPLFRAQIDRCSEWLTPHLNGDLRELLFPPPERAAAEAQRLDQTSITQPALFMIEYALARLWMSWGVNPQAMIGHSLGEYVAACLAGVFSLEDALSLVAARGRLMQELPGGAMLAVTLPEREVQPLLGHGVALAAVNGATQCVVSGEHEAVQRLQEQLVSRRVECRRLPTSHAFHSAMMEPLLAPFASQVRQVRLNPPKIPYISNVTGTWVTDQQATDPNYWAQHLRRCVRFVDGLEQLLLEPNNVLLEVGPGQTLSGLARRSSKGAAGRVVLSSMRHPQATPTDVEHLLHTVGKLWLAGVTVDWAEFHAGERRHRVPLATYPFERQRYWVEPDLQLTSTSTRQPAIRKKPEIEDWFYLYAWKRSLVSTVQSQAPLSSAPGLWLVLVDDDGLGAQLVNRLKREHQPVVSVSMGERFFREPTGVFQINPRQSDDYAALIKQLKMEGQTPTRIVHLWSLNRPAEINNGDGLNEPAIDRGFYSLLYLAQALGQENIINPIEIWAISTNLHDITGTETLCPERAMLLATCKVIPQEYTNVNCRSIDLRWPENAEASEEKLVDQLVAEFSAQSTDLVVAYRGDDRWIQTFEPVHVGPASQSTAPLRPQGVYLILGGLGRFGLLIAKHLAETVQARLVLVGRSPWPAREEWPQRLANPADDDDEVSRKLRKVKALEAAGAEVLIVAANFAEPEQLRAIITQARARFGEINGVIHAAGLQLHTPIQETDRQQCEEMFNSKVRGLVALSQVFGGSELDFCLMTSSVSSILGGLGFAAYSAANLFMDAFTRHINKTKHRPWRTINWEGWHHQEIDHEERRLSSIVNPNHIGSQIAQLVMSDEEVIDCFRRVLPLSAPQLIIATGDLKLRINQWVNLESLRDKPPQQSSETTWPAYARPHLQSAYVAPRDEIERTIAGIEQAILGLAHVGIHDNFFELGGNSLLAVQLISRLRDTFEQQIPLGVLFETPTVAALAEVVREKQPAPADLEELANLLAEIEQLSETEIKNRLAAEWQSAGES